MVYNIIIYLAALIPISPKFRCPLNSFVGIHNHYVTFERAGVSLYVNINDVMVLLML